MRSAEDLARVTPEYAESRLLEMRAIVRQEVLDVLAQGGDLALLQADLGDLVGRDAFGQSASPFVFEASLQGVPVIVTGFAWVYGPGGIPEIRSIIDGYRKAGLKYELAAQAGQGLDGCSLVLTELASPRPNEIWFLAHGHIIGASRYLEPIRIYSFDGYQFRLQWDAGAPRMDPIFEISKDAVSIEYFHDGDAEHRFRDVVSLSVGGPVVSTVEVK